MRGAEFHGNTRRDSTTRIPSIRQATLQMGYSRDATEGTGWNETAGSYNFYARTPAKYTDIFEKQTIVDMEDIRYTIRKVRYSDKQTTKRSRPFTTLV